MKTLPLDVQRWPPELREDHAERSAIIEADLEPTPGARGIADREAARIIRHRVEKYGR